MDRVWKQELVSLYRCLQPQVHYLKIRVYHQMKSNASYWSLALNRICQIVERAIIHVLL
jgi:hypothetical protein